MEVGVPCIAALQNYCILLATVGEHGMTWHARLLPTAGVVYHQTSRGLGDVHTVRPSQCVYRISKRDRDLSFPC